MITTHTYTTFVCILCCFHTEPAIIAQISFKICSFDSYVDVVQC